MAPVSNDAIPESLLDGKSLKDRISQQRVFTVDYREELLLKAGDDYVLDLINEKPFMDAQRYVYAPSCVLYLTEEGNLMPVAVVLATPAKQGKDSLVYTRADPPTEWAIAKAHFLAVDSAVHQLYSHFTRCHANSEVYAIAARRNLSSLHPIFRLLMPHFKDTLRINANARLNLISAEGSIESSFVGGQFSMSLAAAFYGKHFRFKTEGLPKDLEKRGMAKISKKDNKQVVEHVLKDYPYAKDGMLLWNAIENWVTKYVDHYYSDDRAVKYDRELRQWWDDITDKGHPDIVAHGYADFRDMWPLLSSKEELVEILTTIIWIASGHHAAINFGQFNYSGYMPTAPTMCSSEMPERGTYSGYLREDSAVMENLAPIAQAVIVAGVVKFLSYHHDDEEYLGEEIQHWFQDETIKKARDEFEAELKSAAATIEKRNNRMDLPSREGRLSTPYCLLSPFKLEGTEAASGVPNSVSI